MYISNTYTYIYLYILIHMYHYLYKIDKITSSFYICAIFSCVFLLPIEAFRGVNANKFYIVLLAK